MKTLKKTSILIITIVAILAVVYKLSDAKQQKKADINLVIKSGSDATVTVIKAKTEIVKSEIKYHGTFEPSCEVTVVSESQGKVERYSIEEGDYISEGKIITWLDNDMTSYALETAEAAYQKAESDLKRTENLSQSEAISTQQLEDVKIGHKNAKSSYLSIKKQYDNSFIKAPVSGTISKRYFEKGSFLAPGSPVVDIIDTRKMRFKAWFTATDLKLVKAGQKVILSTDLYPGETYEGIIKVIGVKPDNSKRYLVMVELKNKPKNKLVAGIDGSIQINHIVSNKKLVIPRNCIVGSAIHPSVYVVSDHTAKLRPIVIYKTINNLTIVENGLTEGESIVLSGQINLEDNSKVTVLSNQNF